MALKSIQDIDLGTPSKLFLVTKTLRKVMAKIKPLLTISSISKEIA